MTFDVLAILAVIGLYFGPLALGATHIFGFRFGLRSLLVLTTVVAVFLGTLAWMVRH
jgi:hypothetical protein